MPRSLTAPLFLLGLLCLRDVPTDPPKTSIIKDINVMVDVLPGNGLAVPTDPGYHARTESSYPDAMTAVGTSAVFFEANVGSKRLLLRHTSALTEITTYTSSSVDYYLRDPRLLRPLGANLLCIARLDRIETPDPAGTTDTVETSYRMFKVGATTTTEVMLRDSHGTLVSFAKVQIHDIEVNGSIVSVLATSHVTGTKPGLYRLNGDYCDEIASTSGAEDYPSDLCDCGLNGSGWADGGFIAFTAVEGPDKRRIVLITPDGKFTDTAITGQPADLTAIGLRDGARSLYFRDVADAPPTLRYLASADGTPKQVDTGVNLLLAVPISADETRLYYATSEAVRRAKEATPVEATLPAGTQIAAVTGLAMLGNDLEILGLERNITANTYAWQLWKTTPGPDGSTPSLLQVWLLSGFTFCHDLVTFNGSPSYTAFLGDYNVTPNLPQARIGVLRGGTPSTHVLLDAALPATPGLAAPMADGVVFRAEHFRFGMEPWKHTFGT